MQKIPLQPQAPQSGERDLTPRFLLQAIEVLLLGAVWLFVLVWLPFYDSQVPAGVPLAVYKMQWLTVSGLTLVLLVLLWMLRAQVAVSWMQWCALMPVGLSALGMLASLHVPAVGAMANAVAVVQALSGLAYFAVRRSRE